MMMYAETGCSGESQRNRLSLLLTLHRMDAATFRCSQVDRVGLETNGEFEPIVKLKPSNPVNSISLDGNNVRLLLGKYDVL